MINEPALAGGRGSRNFCRPLKRANGIGGIVTQGFARSTRFTLG